MEEPTSPLAGERLVTWTRRKGSSSWEVNWNYTSLRNCSVGENKKPIWRFEWFRLLMTLEQEQCPCIYWASALSKRSTFDIISKNKHLKCNQMDAETLNYWNFLQIGKIMMIKVKSYWICWMEPQSNKVGRKHRNTTRKDIPNLNRIRHLKSNNVPLWLITKPKRHKKIATIWVRAWLSQLSIWLLISAQVMISGSWSKDGENKPCIRPCTGMEPA